MLNEKYFKKTIKLLRAYENCFDGHRLIISDNQVEIKLSYKDGREYSESVWIANREHSFTERKGIEEVYFSIQDELQNKYPHVVLS